MDKVKRAKTYAESELSKRDHDVPSVVMRINHEVISATAGSRSFKITWDPPGRPDPDAPVEKYHIQTHDPK